MNAADANEVIEISSDSEQRPAYSVKVAKLEKEVAEYERMSRGMAKSIDGLVDKVKELEGKISVNKTLVKNLENDNKRLRAQRANIIGHLRCPKCAKIVCCPHSLPCGHVFCYECLLEIIKAEYQRCHRQATQRETTGRQNPNYTCLACAARFFGSPTPLDTIQSVVDELKTSAQRNEDDMIHPDRDIWTEFFQ